MKFLSQINVNTEYTLPMVDGTNGQVLSTDGNGVAYWGTISAGSLTLDGLSDVIITSPSSDQMLRYGLRQGDTVPVWHNFTPNFLTPSSSINALNDVVITTAAVGQILQYNGSNWVNATLSTVEYVSKVQHTVKAGVAITKGQAVYITGADGTNMIVGLASNASEATSSKVIGLAVSNAAINDQIFVVTEGLIAGLNTSTANAGDAVWLGTSGNLIFGLLNKPVAPAHLVYIGVVTRVQQNNGEIFVNVQNGFELNELHDVLINGVSTGQLLRRDSDGLWKNWTPNFLTAEADTLDSITVRGATTTNAITVGGLTVDTNTLVVDATNNRVGIGTAAPGALLQLGQGSTTTDELVRLSVSYTGTTPRGGIVWHDTANVTGKIHTEYNGSTMTSMVFGSLYNSGYNSNALMFIRGDGRIGIGTTSPVAKLDVNGAANATSFSSTELFITNADTSGSLQPDQGDPANKIYSFRWRDNEGGYIDTDNKITFSGFKTPAGTSSQFLKANGTVDSSTYLTSTALNGYATQAWVNLNYYDRNLIDDLFSGAEEITGYNRSNWDAAYNDKINSASFSTTTGVLTLTQQDTGTITVDLDGRYLQAEADTLATVTARGATTNGNIVINGEATIQNSGYLRLIAGSSQMSGFTVFNSAQDGYLSNRITTSAHSRGWGWEFTTNEANNNAGDVFFRVGYNGAVSYLTSGNFGVGTSAPSQKFEVSGGAIIASGFGNRAAGTGKALEIGMDGTSAILQAYDRTASAFIPIVINSSSATFSSGVYASGVWSSSYGPRTAGGNTDFHDSSGNVRARINNVAGVTSVGNRKLSLGILDINSQGSPEIKINTRIPFALGGADFTVNIKGFQYGSSNMVSLSIGWHYYLSQFYNESAISNGSFSPTITLAVETEGSNAGNVVIHLSNVGYWPKLYVESVHSSAYADDYVANWSWSDTGVDGLTSTTVVPYKPLETSITGNAAYATNAGNSATTSQTNFTTLTLSNAGVATQAWVQAQGYASSFSETDTLATVTGRGNSTTTALYLAGGSAEVPALHIRSGGSSWSEGLAIHPSTDSGYGLTFYRTRAAYTDQTNTWAIGNLGDSNALNHFGLLRKGLTGGVADRAGDAIFTINPTGAFKFGFNPYVGTNVIWHAGNDGSGSGLDADLIDGIDSSSILWGNAKGTNDSVTTDADGLDKTGFYTSSAFVTRPDGVENWMYIQHIKLYSANSQYQKQVGYDTYDDRMWVRTKNSGSWTSWKEIVTSDNIGNYALTSLPAHTHTIANVTGLQTALDGKLSAESDTLASVTGRGATTSTPITVTASEGREVAVYMPSSYTTDDLVSGHEYGWYSDHWRLGMTRTGGAAGGDFVIQWNGDRMLSLTNGGGLTIKGSFTEQSSIRYKENVKSIPSVSQKVEQLDAVSYNKIGSNQEEIGLIAEDVAELFPEVVKYDNEGRPDGVNYSRLSVILLKAVQELSQEVNELKKKLN